MKTFEEICEKEPMLRKLFDAIPKMIGSAEDDGDAWIRWSEIKRAFSLLVGHGAGNAELRNCNDYDTVYTAMLVEAERARPGVWR